MSESSNTLSSDPLQAKDQQPPVSADLDWFLQNLVSFSNDWGIEMGITLQVGGLVVTGTLISGATYFQEFADQFANGFKASPELAQAFHGLISSHKQIYDVPKEELNTRPKPHYIHLKDAKFLQPGQPPMPTSRGVLWRGRISEVGGFHLGALSVS